MGLQKRPQLVFKIWRVRDMASHSGRIHSMCWNIHMRVTGSIEITYVSSPFTFQFGVCMTNRLNSVCSCLIILLTINPRSMTLLAASSQQVRTNQLIYWVLGHWYSTFCNLRPSGYFGKWKLQRHGSMNNLLLFHKVFSTTTSGACTKTVWTVGVVRHRDTAM